MNYRVEFGGGAQVQFHSLTKEAREALIDRAVGLIERSWEDAMIRPPSGDPKFRETVFGSGRGIMGFFVDESAQIVRIFDIVWVDWPGAGLPSGFRYQATVMRPTSRRCWGTLPYFGCL